MPVTVIGNKLKVEVLADESTKTQLNEIQREVGDLDKRVADLDSRVDTIITTPAQSVSAQEIIDARQGETSLGANITKVKSQLEQIRTFEDYEIQNKTRKTEALFTIWDDDSTKEMWTVLRPIQQQFNIPMSTAILTNWIDTSLGLTKSQLLQLIDEGWEPTFHGDSQHYLDEMTYEEQYNHFEEVMETLESWGIKGVSTIAYPFSRRNNDTVLAARQFFRAGRSTDYGINRPPFQTWDLMCINGEGKEHTLESLKADIDDISQNGGWGIYLTHANLMSESDVATLEEIIQYVKSKGNIEFVTANEALNRMGNIIDVGRYLARDKSIPHHVVGSDGSTSSNTTPGVFVEHPLGGIDESLLPNQFETGKIHICLTLARNNFPEVGYLVTNNMRKGYAFQELTDITGRKRIRYEVSGDNEWGNWVLIQTNVMLTDSGINSTTPMTDFPRYKVTYTPIPNANIAGFPITDGHGLLETNYMFPTPSGNYQHFYASSTTRDVIYRRRWMNNQWTDWERVNATLSGTSYFLRNFTHYVRGEMVFNTTLNKPLWRNANNDGWVDATGTPVTF